MTLSESRFREHMHYVSTYYQSITLREYAHWRRHGGHLPHNPCVITFDDGFEDFFETARPILTERGLTAVIFVIGSTLVPGERVSWLHDLYATIDSASFAACSRAMAAVVHGYPVAGIETKPQLRAWARKHFADLDSQARLTSIGQLRDELGVDPEPARFLSEAQLRQLVAEGFEIGAHSMHHERLGDLDADALQRELVGGQKEIAAIAATGNLSFSYPFGGRRAWNARTVKRVRDNEYACAVTTVEGLNSSKTDLYELRRIRITGEIPASVLVFRILGLRSLVWTLHGWLLRIRSRPNNRITSGA